MPEWRLERDVDSRHGTHALTNGRARLSIWVGDVDDPDLAELDAQLQRGAATPACPACGSTEYGFDGDTPVCDGCGAELEVAT